jgi:hypothetical protein
MLHVRRVEELFDEPRELTRVPLDAPHSLAHRGQVRGRGSHSLAHRGQLVCRVGGGASQDADLELHDSDRSA